jgi:hypothetical protein
MSSIYHVPKGVKLFATSRNSAPEFNDLNWAAIARDFDYAKPRRPLVPLYARGLFQEAAPQNLAIPPGIPMSQYIGNQIGHQTKSRVSRPGDAISGLVINKRNVEKVENVLRKSQKYPVDFYRDLNMHSKEHAERWLKNAQKSLSSRRNGNGGGRKTRNARKKTRKARH